MQHLMKMWPGMCTRCPNLASQGPGLNVIITPEPSATLGLG